MKTIHHGTTKEGKRFTVVGVADNKKVSFGIALCGPRDPFSRKIGRSIAEGRAIKKPTLVKELKYILPEDKEGKKELIKLGFEVVETVVNDTELYQEILTEQHQIAINNKKQAERAQLLKQPV